MAKRGVWPTCTWGGCDHVRTWESPEAAQKAAERHVGKWVLPDGTAYCACHEPLIVATFPCDVAEQAAHHE